MKKLNSYLSQRRLVHLLKTIAANPKGETWIAWMKTNPGKMVTIQTGDVLVTTHWKEGEPISVDSVGCTDGQLDDFEWGEVTLRIR